jgi:DNA-binding NarL/FixJ family response regulator
MGEPSGTEDRRPYGCCSRTTTPCSASRSPACSLKTARSRWSETPTTDPKAVELAKQRRPDVIVMQVEQEPDEAAAEIRGMLEASPDSRVVVLTVSQDPRRVREMVGLGTSAYVHKSATVEELLGAVRRATTQGPPEGEGDYAVVGMPERMMGQVRTADGHGISARELEVLVLVGRGLSNAQIASRLHLSEATVKRHLANLYPRMDVSSRGAAVSKALSEGWITERDVTGPD